MLGPVPVLYTTTTTPHLCTALVAVYYSTTTCVKLSALDGRWVVSHNLQESRRYHCSWESPVGLVLMGGWYDKYNDGSGNNGFTTTELLSSSGSSSTDSFTLQYETS